MKDIEVDRVNQIISTKENQCEAGRDFMPMSLRKQGGSLHGSVNGDPTYVPMQPVARGSKRKDSSLDNILVN